MTITNYPEAMTEVQARREACDILEEEANQLAMIGINREEFERSFTHRTRIAIGREIIRLRAIARALKGEGECILNSKRRLTN